MKFRDFYNIYMGEDALIRATLIHSRNFTDIDDFVDFKIKELEDKDKRAKIVDVIEMTEAKRINALRDQEAEDNVYHIENIAHFKTLYDFQYVLEENRNAYVVHEDVIEIMNQELVNRGLISTSKIKLSKNETLEPEEISKFKEIYEGPIYWLYDNLTSAQLKKIIHLHGITHYGKYKDDFLKAVISHIASPEHLKEVLAHLSESDLEHIENNVRDNYNIFERKPRFATAEKIGLLVKVHRDYLVMHKDVLEALKSVDFKKINTRKIESENYNAYHLHATLEGRTDIKRDLTIPVRLNFYEMIYVLKEAFLWTNQTNSKIEIGKYELYEKEGKLKANIIQIDALLNTHQTFKFFYDSEDHYVVNVSLIRKRIVDKEVPEVMDYKGPIPIENIGGVDKLTHILEVLENRKHPDYALTYNQVKNKNYRERFPISAINRHLSRTFLIRRPKI